MADAHYTVTVERFKAVDESGADWTGSDEPYWVFTGKTDGGQTETARSKVFGDVDSGETRSFPSDGGADIVWPKRGDRNGAKAPIGLTIQLYESDQGDPDQIAKRTEQAFDLGSQAPFVGEWIRRVPSIVRDQLAKALADDMMGSHTLLFPAGRLARRLPRAGSSFTQRLRFSGSGGDLPFEVAGGPDYDLWVQVTRTQ